jgi:hypothetical protein
MAVFDAMKDPEFFSVWVLLDATAQAFNQALRLAAERDLAVDVEVRTGTAPSVRVMLRRKDWPVVESNEQDTSASQPVQEK